jgi:hypothetical protein
MQVRKTAPIILSHFYTLRQARDKGREALKKSAFVCFLLQVGLGLAALFPLLILIAPANVSSSCDELLNQMNDISFMGNRHHKVSGHRSF